MGLIPSDKYYCYQHRLVYASELTEKIIALVIGNQKYGKIQTRSTIEKDRIVMQFGKWWNEFKILYLK